MDTTAHKLKQEFSEKTEEQKQAVLESFNMSKLSRKERRALSRKVIGNKKPIKLK